MIWLQKDGIDRTEIYIHELFSKDSGFMEAVEWKESKEVLARNYYDDNTDETNRVNIDYMCDSFRYMVM